MSKTERKADESKALTLDQEVMAIDLLESAYETVKASNDEDCRHWLGHAYSLLVELGRPVQPVQWDWDELRFRETAPPAS
jgi:hypothetical protein